MPTEKKTGKKSKNNEKEIENQNKSPRKNTKTLSKIKKKELEKRTKVIDEKANIIKEDLKEQLLSQNKFGKQFEDMIEDYVFLVKLKEELQNDIKTKGLRYTSFTGNGYLTEKANESVQNLLKVNGQMLKILQDLELKAPDEEGEGDDLLQ